MRVLFVLLVGVITTTFGYIPRPVGEKNVDEKWLQRELEVLKLFRYVYQPSFYPEFIEIGKEFDIQDNLIFYSKPEVVKEFLYMFNNGMLPKGQIFSVFYEDHLKQAIALFKVFFYAKDWPTLWKTAAWARQNVNEEMFVYSFSVALVHRSDTKDLILPPVYDIMPYYFYHTTAIHEAQKYKQLYGMNNVPKDLKITVNYTGNNVNIHHDKSLSYFYEDVGLNAYYYYWHLHYPFWMNPKEFGVIMPRRGEQHYFFYQQLLARYYMERLSNNLGQIPMLNYEQPITEGFYTSLQYSNGLHFPVRPKNIKLNERDFGSHAFFYQNYSYAYELVKDYERRIREVIDLGYFFENDGSKVHLSQCDGMEVLGKLIEGDAESPNSRYFGNLEGLGRYLLGYSYQPLDKYKVTPSALEHFETSLRDPIFYQFFERIVKYFQKYKSYLPPYKYEDLAFEGIEIKKVEMDKLITYFEHFTPDLTNAMYVSKEECLSDASGIKGRQARLTHKPFGYKLYVKSGKPVKALVKAYIGPKYDEYGRVLNITWNRLNFVEFERFTVDLVPGENVLSRWSVERWSEVHSFKELYDIVKAKLNGIKDVKLFEQQYTYDLPYRFVLPKGTKDGMKFQFAFMITKYEPYITEAKGDWYLSLPMYKFMDNKAYGFPFDREINNESVFTIPNLYFYEAPIYHEERINKKHL